MENQTRTRIIYLDADGQELHSFTTTNTAEELLGKEHCHVGASHEAVFRKAGSEPTQLFKVVSLGNERDPRLGDIYVIRVRKPGN